MTSVIRSSPYCRSLQQTVVACCLALLLVGNVRVLIAQEPTANGLLKRHEQARSLAIQIVKEVFDTQLKQLEENRLSGMPIHAQILQARSNIERLTANEMQQLTQLLSRFQENDDERQFDEARISARQIAVKMIAERQRLRVRSRSSRVLILLRQLIAVEEQSIESTQRLLADSSAEPTRPRQQLVQSHLDIAVLIDQLTHMLNQSVDANGQNQYAATLALSKIASAQPLAHVNEAIESIKSHDYQAALKTEQSILASLRSLLRIWQNSSDLEQAARDNAIKAIAETVKQQQELRDDTQVLAEADSLKREELATQQRSIAAQLDELRSQLSQVANVDGQLLAASDAAKQASHDLESAKHGEATKQQDRVLKLLEEVSRQLNGLVDSDLLADRVAELKELGSSLDDLVDKQAEASELAANDPTSAAEIEAAIAEALNDADDASELSNGVESQIDEAQQAVARAEEALEDGSPAAEQSRLEAVEDAEKALMEAVAEVQSQLAEAEQAMEASNPSESDSSSESTSKNEAASGTTRDSTSANISGSAVDTESRSFENEAWFTRLPADLQARIRAATRRPAPRGYETRLRRYFETRD